MGTFKDRIVFVTGASSGFGAACAEAFAKRGADLLVCARRFDRLKSMADEWRSAYGIRVHPFELDVTRQKDVERAIGALPDEWKEIEILVNNAGKALGLGKSYESKIDHIDGMMDTNVKGLLYVNRAVVPGMVARGRGHIINIGSVAGRWVYPGGTVYCASKHAVRAINEGLKMDVHGTGVRVSSVDPGLAETEFSIVRFEGDMERAKQVYQGVDALTAEDVAEAVIFCANRPPHVNINEISLMCTDQSAATMVHRRA
jgi:3-hydroxy acid dehydrogenase/malonic semialdehyde reductase